MQVSRLLYSCVRVAILIPRSYRVSLYPTESCVEGEHSEGEVMFHQFCGDTLECLIPHIHPDVADGLDSFFVVREVCIVGEVVHCLFPPFVEWVDERCDIASLGVFLEEVANLPYDCKEFVLLVGWCAEEDGAATGACDKVPCDCVVEVSHRPFVVR